jgi:hypothetical protein
MTQANYLTNFIQLRQLLANLSLRSPGFTPRADYEEFLTDKVVLDLLEHFRTSTSAPHSLSIIRDGDTGSLRNAGFLLKNDESDRLKSYCNILLAYFPYCISYIRLLESCRCLYTTRTSLLIDKFSREV